ncbi:MAG TPA: type II toxin-antitoxin system death-on-curing family toxin, partial [Salinarimonas sp.]|nr:type II toxin-antitoxin system death-on-curing family toxin [Salinarimonas sp.]
MALARGCLRDQPTGGCRYRREPCAPSESALWRPVHRFNYQGETDIVVLAVAMLLGVAANHPFEQGNKRTAFMAAVLFLNANGYQLRLPDDRTISQTIVDVITG